MGGGAEKIQTPAMPQTPIGANYFRPYHDRAYGSKDLCPGVEQLIKGKNRYGDKELFFHIFLSYSAGRKRQGNLTEC